MRPALAIVLFSITVAAACGDNATRTTDAAGGDEADAAAGADGGGGGQADGAPADAEPGGPDGGAGDTDAGAGDVNAGGACGACDDHASCVGGVCVCDDGFGGDGASCADVDECDEGTHDCDDNATCANTVGGFTCTCDDGFTGDGVTCTDIDECATGADDCDVNATCADTDGGFTCTCNPGFAGDGTTCTDADECLAGSDDCGDHASCTNTAGGFVCLCDAGWTGDGHTCTDVDECAAGTDTCDPRAVCADTDGSYTCTCEAGFSGDGRTCTDVDECAAGGDNDCGVDARCFNNPGGFTCACQSGWGGDPHVQCFEIDECELGIDNCDDDAICDNTDGSFICTCPGGFTGDGLICDDIDECLDETADCDVHATCTNTNGSFDCECFPGTTGDGTECEDVDQCTDEPITCDAPAVCQDWFGNDHCGCPLGTFDVEGDGSVCQVGASGNGHAVLIGHDLYDRSVDADRIVGNAIFLANTSGRIRVLAYAGHSDPSDDEPGHNEPLNTDAAIRHRAYELGRGVDILRFTDESELADRLPGTHVLLVYEQEQTDGTTLAGIGAGWVQQLNQFVRAGGVVVVQDHNGGNGGTWQVVNSAGLINVSGSNERTDEAFTVVAAADPIAAGVGATYLAPDGSLSFNSSDAATLTVVEDAGDLPAVLHKTFTPGGCLTLEDFESGSWPGDPGEPWVKATDILGPGSASAGAAHDGGFGAQGEYDWYYQVGPVFGAEGDVLSAWIHIDATTTERGYFGFSADATGARSFVLAPNSSPSPDIRFQNNPGYGYEELTTSAQSWATDWFRAEVVFGEGGVMTGNLYDSDGITLLNTVTHDFGTEQLGGVAMQAYGAGTNFDTMSVCFGNPL